MEICWISGKKCVSFWDLWSLLRFLNLHSTSLWIVLISFFPLLKFWSLIWLVCLLLHLSDFFIIVRCLFRLLCRKALSVSRSWILGIVDGTVGLSMANISKSPAGEFLRCTVYPCRSGGKIFETFVNLPLSNQIFRNGLRLNFRGHALKKSCPLMKRGLWTGTCIFMSRRNWRLHFPSKCVLKGRKFWLSMPSRLPQFAPIFLGLQLKKVCMNIGRTLQALHLLWKRIDPIQLRMLRIVFLLFKELTCCKKSALRVVDWNLLALLRLLLPPSCSSMGSLKLLGTGSHPSTAVPDGVTGDVDGSGGAKPLLKSHHDDVVPVTPTVGWTARPKTPSDEPFLQSLKGMSQKAEDAAVGIPVPNHPTEPQNAAVGIPVPNHPAEPQSSCSPRRAKKCPTDGEPWISTHTSSKILAPIAEGETNGGLEDTGGTVNGASKPRALPVRASLLTKNELAKVSTAQPSQSQPPLDGYVYGLSVTANPEPQVPGVQKPTMTYPVPNNDLTVGQDSSQIVLNGDILFEEPKEKSLRGLPRRSKSAGQPPLTPSRRTGATGNSKSCPPARLKPSPTKEVIKHGVKPPRDQPLMSGLAWTTLGSLISSRTLLCRLAKHRLLPDLQGGQKVMPSWLMLKASLRLKRYGSKL